MLDLIVQPGLVLPSDSLCFSAVRSSGPGGQHVNKTSSKVVLRFDLPGCPTLSPEQRSLIQDRTRNRLDSLGFIQIECQATRSQHQNLEEARNLLAALLLQALRVQPPRKPTKTPARAHRRRIQDKKHRAGLKRARGKADSE